MATMPVIDDLDRCKSALQYIADGQSDSLSAVLKLLVERLEDALGQAHAQLRQCTCGARPRLVRPQARATWCPYSPPKLPANVSPWASGDTEDLDAEDEGLCPDA